LTGVAANPVRNKSVLRIHASFDRWCKKAMVRPRSASVRGVRWTPLGRIGNLPRSANGSTNTRTILAGIRADKANRFAFPCWTTQAQWRFLPAVARARRLLTVAGAAHVSSMTSPVFPV